MKKLKKYESDVKRLGTKKMDFANFKINDKVIVTERNNSADEDLSYLSSLTDSHDQSDMACVNSFSDIEEEICLTDFEKKRKRDQRVKTRC